MSKWLDSNQVDRLFMIQKVAEEKNIEEVSVEKDWWVSIILKAIFSTRAAEYMYFKGGTSLSKAWDLINRFSEDIDIALYRDFFSKEERKDFTECESKSQRERLRKIARRYVVGEFKEDLDCKLHSMGLDGFKIDSVTTLMTSNGNRNIDSDKDPTVINIIYKSIISKPSDYIEPKVKIEVSCLSMKEPFETMRISSMISELFEGEDDDTISEIKTISPSRTFLEKAFLLNEEYQKNNPRTERMSRHLYDLERLMDTCYAKSALSDRTLYDAIIAHREKFYHLKGVDYSQNKPECIAFCPIGDLLSKMEKDYNQMKSSFIYGTPLSFSDLIDRIAELQNRFRALSTPK